MAIDPVVLVRGPTRAAATLRCPKCGLRQRHSNVLPTGGIECAQCRGVLNAADRIQYASPTERVVATIIDVVALAAPLSILLLVYLSTAQFAPTDDRGFVTRNGQIVFAAIGGAYFLLYLWFVEATGASVGKLLMSIRVVRAGDWRSPGLIRGLLRLGGKLLSVATLGLGFVIMLRDAEGRTLEDRLAGTRVIER